MLQIFHCETSGPGRTQKARDDKKAKLKFHDGRAEGKKVANVFSSTSNRIFFKKPTPKMTLQEIFQINSSLSI